MLVIGRWTKVHILGKWALSLWSKLLVVNLAEVSGLSRQVLVDENPIVRPDPTHGTGSDSRDLGIREAEAVPVLMGQVLSSETLRGYMGL